VLRSRGEEISLIRDGVTETRRGNPFDVAGELLNVYSLEASPTGIPFVGGAVGYFSYDLCHFIERLPTTAVDDLSLPECYLAFYDTILAFDHLEGKPYIVATGFPELAEEKRKQRATERIKELKNRLLNYQVPTVAEESGSTLPAEGVVLKSNFSREEYIKAVATAREYICAGDIFQVNLSQRFETTCHSGLRLTCLCRPMLSIRNCAA